MACNRLYVWTIAVSKWNMRWLAIVRTYEQLHSKNWKLKKGLQSFVHANNCSPKMKYEMTCNCSHVRTIALQKLKIKKKACNHLYVRTNATKKTWLAVVQNKYSLQPSAHHMHHIRTISHEKIKHDMTCNRLYMRTIAVHKFKTNLACNRSFAHTNNFIQKMKYEMTCNCSHVQPPLVQHNIGMIEF